MAELGLVVPTRDLPHRLAGLLTIDHIAVGAGADVLEADHHVPLLGGRHLSDHDAYFLTSA